MKQLAIQVHHSADDSEQDHVIAQVMTVFDDLDKAIKQSLCIQKSDVYTDFLTQAEIWNDIKPHLEDLKLKMIVVCEGEEGWDDYLLLHHFDPQQKLDPSLNCHPFGGMTCT